MPASLPLRMTVFTSYTNKCQSTAVCGTWNSRIWGQLHNDKQGYVHRFPPSENVFNMHDAVALTVCFDPWALCLGHYSFGAAKVVVLFILSSKDKVCVLNHALGCMHYARARIYSLPFPTGQCHHCMSHYFQTPPIPPMRIVHNLFPKPIAYSTRSKVINLIVISRSITNTLVPYLTCILLYITCICPWAPS